MDKGKNAIITGSTSGIGYGIATVLAKAGCNIMLNGFTDQATLERLKKELSVYNTKISFNGADISKASEVQTLIEKTVEEFGSVDILVNNAGIQHVDKVESFPDSSWDAIIATNLSSCFHSIKHALPIMRKQNWGRIINIASAHGLVASEGKIAYVSAKHGVCGLTKVVALETAKDNITCNAICPGWVLTPLVKEQIEENAKAKNISIAEAEIELLDEKQPSHKFVQSDQIGDLVLFLCSEAASQMKGSIISIDGGWVAR